MAPGDGALSGVWSLSRWQLLYASGSGSAEENGINRMTASAPVFETLSPEGASCHVMRMFEQSCREACARTTSLLRTSPDFPSSEWATRRAGPPFCSGSARNAFRWLSPQPTSWLELPWETLIKNQLSSPRTLNPQQEWEMIMVIVAVSHWVLGEMCYGAVDNEFSHGVRPSVCWKENNCHWKGMSRQIIIHNAEH